MEIIYPTRCRIIDVTGQRMGPYELNTPEISKAHIGKEGLAEKVDGVVRITLDDDNLLYGHICWWTPIA